LSQSLKNQPEVDLTQTQVFILTKGMEDEGIAGMALAMAAHAAAYGREVFVFLTLEATKWAHTNFGKKYSHRCFDQPGQHIQTLLDFDAKVIVCSACIDETDEKKYGVLAEGIVIGGFTDIQAEMDGASVVYSF
jgi:predicted peroxiredoxin